MFLLIDSEIVVWKATISEKREFEKVNSVAEALGRPPAASAETGPPGSLSPRGLGWTGPMGDQPQGLGAAFGQGAGLSLCPLVCPLFTPESESRRPARPRRAEIGGRKDLRRACSSRKKGRARQGPRPERAMQDHLRPPGEGWTSVLLQAVQACSQTWPAGRDRGFCQCRPECGRLLAWVTGSLGLGGVLLSLWVGWGRGAAARIQSSTFAKALSPQGPGRSPVRGAHRSPLILRVP